MKKHLFLLVMLVLFMPCVQAQKPTDLQYKNLKNAKIDTLINLDKYVLRSVSVPKEEKYGSKTRIKLKTVNYDLVSKDGSKQIIFQKIELKRPMATNIHEVEQNGKSGVLNIEDGFFVVPVKYKYVKKLTDSVYVGEKSTNQEEVYAWNGQQIILETMGMVRYDQKNHIIYDALAKKLVTYKTDGTILVKYNAAIVTKADDYFILEKDKKQGIVDLTGKELLPFIYYDILIGNNKGYLILGKQMPDKTIRYGMYTDYTLKNEIFPMTYDMLGETTLSDRDKETTSDVFYYSNNRTSDVYVLDENKKEIFTVKVIADDVLSFDKAGDNYIVRYTDDRMEIFTNGHETLPGSVYYTEYDKMTYMKGLENYLLFNSEYGQRTALVPLKYDPKKTYYFKSEYPAFTYYSNKCYTIFDEENGMGFFLPGRSSYLVYRKGESYDDGPQADFLRYANLVLLNTENVDNLLYDLDNDSLVHIPASKTFAVKTSTALDYLCNKVNPYLKKYFSKGYKGNTLASQKTDNNHYRWNIVPYDEELFTVPFDFPETKSYALYNKTGQPLTSSPFKVWDLTWNDMSSRDISVSVSAVFTDSWKLLKPMGKGHVRAISILPTDTVIAIEFTPDGDPDSIQVFSCAKQKTLYFSQIYKLSQVAYFYPVLRTYGFTNAEGKTGIIDYDGNLVVPFKYDELIESPDGRLVSFYNGKFLHYFPESKITIKGSSFEGWQVVDKTNCFLSYDDKEKTGIYDIKTGKCILPHSSEFPDLAAKSRYIKVGWGQQWGVFDLTEQKLVVPMTVDPDDLEKTYREKYANVKLE